MPSNFLTPIHNIEDSELGKSNALLNLISHRRDMNKVFLYTKSPYEATYQLIIKKRESIRSNIAMILRLIELSNDMVDTYENVNE